MKESQPLKPASDPATRLTPTTKTFRQCIPILIHTTPTRKATTPSHPYSAIKASETKMITTEMRKIVWSAHQKKGESGTSSWERNFKEIKKNRRIHRNMMRKMVILSRAIRLFRASMRLRRIRVRKRKARNHPTRPVSLTWSIMIFSPEEMVAFSSRIRNRIQNNTITKTVSLKIARFQESPKDKASIHSQSVNRSKCHLPNTLLIK